MKKKPNTALINQYQHQLRFTPVHPSFFILVETSHGFILHVPLVVFLLPHWDSEPYILFDPLKVEVNVIPICQEVDGRFVDFFSKMQIYGGFWCFFFRFICRKHFCRGVFVFSMFCILFQCWYSSTTHYVMGQNASGLSSESSLGI